VIILIITSSVVPVARGPPPTYFQKVKRLCWCKIGFGVPPLQVQPGIIVSQIIGWVGSGASDGPERGDKNK